MSAPTTTTYLLPGDVFTNGASGTVAHGFDWHATLTVVRADDRTYGVKRYIVRDSTGRHGYAY